MAKFTAVSSDAFAELGLEAGVLLYNFNPETAAAPSDEDIVCATSGGINATCVPQFSDYGNDVDNVPNNTKEMLHLDSYECKMSFTALSVTAETIKLSLGAAAVSAKKITPDGAGLVKSDRFKDIWWVGDRSDGGFAAVCLKNALSTGGLSIKTTKNGKAQLAVELTGHYSISALDDVPMEFYVSEGA